MCYWERCLNGREGNWNERGKGMGNSKALEGSAGQELYGTFLLLDILGIWKNASTLPVP